MYSAGPEIHCARLAGLRSYSAATRPVLCVLEKRDLQNRRQHWDRSQGSCFPRTVLLRPGLCCVMHSGCRGERAGAAFIVATRAVTLPVFLLPGLSGSAMFIVAIILLCKGYRIKGLRGLDMPSNWMSLHWGISRKCAEKIIERGKHDVERFTQKIFSGRRHLFSFNNVFELVFGTALVPISAGYLLIGRLCSRHAFLRELEMQFFWPMCSPLPCHAPLSQARS